MDKNLLEEIIKRYCETYGSVKLVSLESEGEELHVKIGEGFSSKAVNVFKFLEGLNELLLPRFSHIKRMINDNNFLDLILIDKPNKQGNGKG